MKTGKTKRLAVLLTALVFSCLLIAPAANCLAAGSGNYYPGPEEKPEEPVVIVSPDPTPVTEAPTLAPTPTPAPAAPTPEVTPQPPQYPISKPKATPTPVPEEEVEEYTLEIYYHYTDGSSAAVPYVETFQPGEQFDVKSPEIPGKKANRDKVSGTMSTQNVSITVYYYDTSASGYVIFEDYDTPLGLGNVIINIGDCYE